MARMGAVSGGGSGGGGGGGSSVADATDAETAQALADYRNAWGTNPAQWMVPMVVQTWKEQKLQMKEDAMRASGEYGPFQTAPKEDYINPFKTTAPLNTGRPSAGSGVEKFVGFETVPE